MLAPILIVHQRQNLVNVTAFLLVCLFPPPISLQIAFWRFVSYAYGAVFLFYGFLFRLFVEWLSKPSIPFATNQNEQAFNWNVVFREMTDLDKSRRVPHTSFFSESLRYELCPESALISIDRMQAKKQIRQTVKLSWSTWYRSLLSMDCSGIFILACG